MNIRIILASASPRRKQLMAQLGIDCEIIESGIDETAAGSAREQVKTLALRKAAAVREGIGGEAVIIAADTLVALGDKILSKPDNRACAFAMLRALAGNWHTVYTGVAIIRTCNATADRIINFVEAARVLFRPLTDEEINNYIDSGEPFDKAGAYGVQGRAASFAARIEGDYFAVVGLPLSRLVVALKELDVR